MVSQYCMSPMMGNRSAQIQQQYALVQHATDSAAAEYRAHLSELAESFRELASEEGSEQSAAVDRMLAALSTAQHDAATTDQSANLQGMRAAVASVCGSDAFSRAAYNASVRERLVTELAVTLAAEAANMSVAEASLGAWSCNASSYKLFIATSSINERSLHYMAETQKHQTPLELISNERLQAILDHSGLPSVTAAALLEDIDPAYFTDTTFCDLSKRAVIAAVVGAIDTAVQRFEWLVELLLQLMYQSARFVASDRLRSERVKLALMASLTEGAGLEQLPVSTLALSVHDIPTQVYQSYMQALYQQEAMERVLHSQRMDSQLLTGEAAVTEHIRLSRQAVSAFDTEQIATLNQEYW